MSILKSLLSRKPEQAMAERLASYNVEWEIAARLSHWLSSAPEREVYRVNSRYLADQLGLPLRQTLNLLAQAIVAGVVVLEWESRCPHCGVHAPAFQSLAVATSHQICQTCGPYEAALDQQILVSFSVNDALRSLGPGSDDMPWRRQIDQRYGLISGHDLLAIQAFRDLLINEPLPIHESFKILRVALLFTDLGGSTALYARKGDPRAYGLVREHFDLLFRAVDEAGGAVIKTIGDAVMAVFPLSERALAAALAGQRAIAEFNRRQQLAADEALQLKAGIHAGPCLAVTLNERLDYFGTTVNAAARVEKQAGAGEILLTSDVYQDLPQPELLAELSVTTEELMLRGLDERTFTVYRCRAG